MQFLEVFLLSFSRDNIGQHIVFVKGFFHFFGKNFFKKNKKIFFTESHKSPDALNSNNF